METNLHNFNDNLILSKETIDLRARIRRFYELVFIGCKDIEQPSYETYQGKNREQTGIDSSIYFENKIFTIQEKIRRPKYWSNRNKDLFIETHNEARPEGKGWLFHYVDCVDFIGWYFMSESEKIYFILYNFKFFNICLDYYLNNSNDLTRPHY